MKKFIWILAIVMILILSLAIFGVSCKTETAATIKAAAETTKAAESTTTAAETTAPETTVNVADLPVLKVAVMPFLFGSIPKYIIDKGWDIENGFKIERIVFASGAPMNEALGANLFDIGLMGGAAPFGVANYDAKIVADFDHATAGIEAFVRPDSPIAKVKGFNPDYPDVYGNPETVKGKTAITAIGTTNHILIVNWGRIIGLGDNDIKLISMTIPQGYQAFLTGQADIVALNPPFSLQAVDNGWVKVITLDDTGAKNCDTLMVNKNSYEPKKELLTKFVKLVFRANDELMKDQSKYIKLGMAWYAENGQQVTEQQVAVEAKFRPLITTEEAKNFPHGAWVKDMGEFMVSIGKIQEDKLPLFTTNITDEIIKAALK
ncbi:MAG: ABC transporter substrate-binding protein [Candidatus Humimicrobiaceae bacterium]